MSTVMGAESRQEAVRKCIREFNSKGIPAFVDAAGREWSPEAYINMDIRTTVSNTANAAQDARCDDYGIDLIAVSSHPGARPKCAPYQGRVFSRSNKSGIAHDGNGKEIHYEPLSSTSYGEPDGLFGINCRHKKYPFIDGVNFQRYFPYDKEENDKRYKEIQEQRRLERKVRSTKREADMLNEIGDTDGAKAARVKLKEQRKAYRTYCDEHELTQRNDRLTVSKTSISSAKTQKPLDNGGGSGIIKSNVKSNFIEHSQHKNDFGVIQTYTNEEIKAELFKSEAGRRAVEHIDNKAIYVEFDYNPLCPSGKKGYYFCGSIHVYMANASDLEDVAKTVIHEATHSMIDSAENSMREEFYCRIQEYYHTKKILTIDDLLDIAREIKSTYGDTGMKWREPNGYKRRGYNKEN